MSEVERVQIVISAKQNCEPAGNCAALDELLASFRKTKKRGLHGLALRTAIDLFELSQIFPLAAAKLNPRRILQDSLMRVQANDRILDVVKAKQLLSVTVRKDVESYPNLRQINIPSTFEHR